MNEWVLVTGASSGIGLELARLFAADKFNLILTARNQAALDLLANELRAAHRVEVDVIPADLAKPAAAVELYNRIQQPVEILVNNAGLGFYGDFATSDLEQQTQVMQVNMIALTQLTHLFLNPMIARGHGRILNVASTAAFQPGPSINVYYASKAFVHSFSYALAQEVESRGITVTALCPGTTHTDFFQRGNFKAKRAPGTMSAAVVAKAGYAGLMRGRRVVIPGWHNKVASMFAKRLPLSLTSAIVRRVHSQ
jgi:uncharacterized protein